MFVKNKKKNLLFSIKEINDIHFMTKIKLFFYFSWKVNNSFAHNRIPTGALEKGFNPSTFKFALTQSVGSSPFFSPFLTTYKKKLTHFATKSSEIIISSRRAGSTLQKRSLLYETQ
jgi:hypothetical protein